MSHISVVSETSSNETPGPKSPRSNQFRPNPFSTPPLTSYSHPSTRPNTRPGSFIESSTGSQTDKPNEYFRSRRTARKTADDPPREVLKNKREKWLWIIPTIGFVLGLAICGLMVYTGIRSEEYKYCPVLMEDFSSGTLDPNVWTMEVEVGGFSNGEFEETTTSNDNIFIKDGQLHIQPTLQDTDLIDHNSVLNLTKLGTCTGNYWADCVTSTNTTNGTIVQPVKSARLNTKKGASITYGRVEVTAKVAQGDWLWNAIWMLPVDNKYGPWPASGEIDITESRGNNYTYGPGGNNLASSSLHWGPDTGEDAYLKTTNEKSALHSQYGDDFHVYGLEWTPKALYTYIDTQLLQVYYLPFNEPFWKRGQFPAASTNGTLLVNPWASSPDNSAPFDAAFYLILDVAVGGTNGYFPDGAGNKPWVDASPTAKTEFWNGRDQWYSTWKKSSAMIVDSVKMWKQC